MHATRRVSFRFCVLLLLAVAVSCDSESNAPKAATQEDAPAAYQPPPNTLAGGALPAPMPLALRRFRGKPVLGARRLQIHSRPVRSCRLPGSSRYNIRLRAAWLSTEGISVERSLSGPAGHGLVSCDAVLVENRWRRCGLATSRSDDPRQEEAAGGAPTSCSQLGRRTAFMWIAAQGGRDAWTLVDHGGYWVGYSSSGGRLRVSWVRGRSSRFRVRVAFVTARGQVLAERLIEGHVAG